MPAGIMAESSRGVYVLGYDVTAEMADGRLHTARIRVAREELEIYAKEGYFAPKGPG